jgi:hypothetical protein
MPRFQIQLSESARSQLENLIKNPSKKSVAKAVLKSLDFMHSNLRHPSLKTHKYGEISGPNGEEVFESYAQIKPLALTESFGSMNLSH